MTYVKDLKSYDERLARLQRALDVPVKIGRYVALRNAQERLLYWARQQKLERWADEATAKLTVGEYNALALRIRAQVLADEAARKRA